MMYNLHSILYLILTTTLFQTKHQDRGTTGARPQAKTSKVSVSSLQS